MGNFLWLGGFLAKISVLFVQKIIWRENVAYMKKIDENFYGYIRVEGDTYTYNVSDNIVTLLPAQSDPQKRDDSLYRIKSHKTDTPEYLFGEDNNSMIAILRNGKFVTDPIGTNVAIRFATPIIIKACGNAEGFFNMLTEDWCKFHAITFCGGNINALYTPGIAIEQPDVSELLKYDGARTIKMRPWSAYTRTTQFQIENEKVTLTVSIGQTAETNNAENRGAYNLGKVYTFFRFSFENAQGFEKMEKYYIIARKIVAILTSQNNISVNENSIASFVKLRNNKTHSGTVEWGESAKIYTPLFAIVYASFFKYIKLPDEVIKSTLLQIF